MTEEAREAAFCNEPPGVCAGEHQEGQRNSVFFFSLEKTKRESKKKRKDGGEKNSKKEIEVGERGR